MPNTELDLLRQRLEEQFRADVQLLYDGYCAKLRAYEAVFLGQGRLDPAHLPALSLGAPPVPGLQLTTAAAFPDFPPPAAKPARKRPRQGPNELRDAVITVLGRLDEVFDKHDVARALGYEPTRANLHQILLDLRFAGVLAVEKAGGGRTPTRYRKPRPASSDPGSESTG